MPSTRLETVTATNVTATDVTATDVTAIHVTLHTGEGIR
jgi:hypothetical protein